MNNIIQKDGKYYQIGYPVLLPTKESNLFLGTEDRLHYSKIPTKGYKPQHLYVLSDEEIKEGEYGIYKVGFNVLGDTYDIIHVNNPTKVQIAKELKAKKIIATTDKSITEITAVEFGTNYIEEKSIPRPSNDFLQAYVKAQGKMDKVLVEIQMYNVKDEKTDTPDVDNFISTPYSKPELKLSPDNTITIIPFEEDKEVIIKMTQDEAKKILLCLKATHSRNNHGNLSNILDTCDKVENEIFSQIKW